MDVNRLMRTVGALLVAYALGVVTGLWYAAAPTAPIGEAVEAKPDPALKGADTEILPCEQVKVYKTPAKKKLALPAAVQDNPNQHVTTSIRLPADLYPHRVTSVLDVGTGETRTYDQRLALPWLALDTHGEAGISYGYKGDERILRLEARQAIVDIKAIKVGAVASFDQPLGGHVGRDGYLGVGAWWRW